VERIVAATSASAACKETRSIGHEQIRAAAIKAFFDRKRWDLKECRGGWVPE
jgi:hypothetical protein